MYTALPLHRNQSLARLAQRRKAGQGAHADCLKMKGGEVVHSKHHPVFDHVHHDQIPAPASSLHAHSSWPPALFPAPHLSSCQQPPVSLSDKLQAVSILVQDK